MSKIRTRHSSDADKAAPAHVLQADSTYPSLRALSDALHQIGLGCLTLRGGDDVSISGCDTQEGGYTELTLYLESGQASTERVNSLSSNPLMCASDFGIGLGMAYLRGQNWMILSETRTREDLMRGARRIGVGNARI